MDVAEVIVPMCSYVKYSYRHPSRGVHSVTAAVMVRVLQPFVIRMKKETRGRRSYSHGERIEQKGQMQETC